MSIQQEKLLAQPSSACPQWSSTKIRIVQENTATEAVAAIGLLFRDPFPKFSSSSSLLSAGTFQAGHFKDWEDARHEVQNHPIGEGEQNGDDEARLAARTCRHRIYSHGNVEVVRSAAAQFQDTLEPAWQFV